MAVDWDMVGTAGVAVAVIGTTACCITAAYAAIYGVYWPLMATSIVNIWGTSVAMLAYWVDMHRNTPKMVPYPYPEQQTEKKDPDPDFREAAKVNHGYYTAITELRETL